MTRPSPFRRQRAQRGVILFIALIVLVAMSLAGIALIRSVDTNVMIAGNLAFRQGATLAGDRGIEHARAWLRTPANFASLPTNQPGGISWYWANWQPTINVIKNYDWSKANNLGEDAVGNEVRYVIHRMCEYEGSQNESTTNCIKVPSAGEASGTKGAVGYGTQALPGSSSTYYRVSVRIKGPRNTVSYVQSMLN